VASITGLAAAAAKLTRLIWRGHRRRWDKRLSLVDAVSFAVIRALALDGAFTFDQDFRDCGFEVFPPGDGDLRAGSSQFPSRLSLIYTSSFQGARYFAFRNGLTASCFTVQFASSQSSQLS
jgi:hypothetical protein